MAGNPLVKAAPDRHPKGVGKERQEKVDIVTILAVAAVTVGFGILVALVAASWGT